MSALDRQYDVWDMAMVIDELEPPYLGFYTYAGARRPTMGFPKPGINLGSNYRPNII